jgi:hypothetical protein
VPHFLLAPRLSPPGGLLGAYAYGVAIFFAEVQFAGAGFGLFASAFGASQICS